MDLKARALEPEPESHITVQHKGGLGWVFRMVMLLSSSMVPWHGLLILGVVQQ